MIMLEAEVLVRVAVLLTSGVLLTVLRTEELAVDCASTEDGVGVTLVWATDELDKTSRLLLED